MTKDTPKKEEQKSKSHFEILRNVDVSQHLETKGSGNFKANYLSWAWAVDYLLQQDPDAKWEYLEPVTFKDGTVMVYCSVTAFGKTRTMQLPVMNHQNKAIKDPDAFAVNTAMQRCLVKAIALHGLGLYVYAGEDLPPDQQDEKPEPQKQENPLTKEEKDKLLTKIALSKTLEELAAAQVELGKFKSRMNKDEIDLFAKAIKGRKEIIEQPEDNIPQ